MGTNGDVRFDKKTRKSKMEKTQLETGLLYLFLTGLHLFVTGTPYNYAAFSM